MNKIILALLLLFSFPLYAGTYYVDDNGEVTTWANCEENGGTPGLKSGAAACTLATANANASADDIVYLRGGTYPITSSGINPTKSGTAVDHMITFSGYESEEVNFIGAASTTGINLSSDSYIKITKMNFSGTRYGFTISGGGHNEISYCTFVPRDPWADIRVAGVADADDATGVTLTDNDPTTGTNLLNEGSGKRVWNKTDNSTMYGQTATATTLAATTFPLTGGTDNKWEIGDEYEITLGYTYDASFLDIHGNSVHNYINHNTAHGQGGYLPHTGEDGSPIMQIGNDTGTSNPNNDNNTVEHNHFYNAGHHVLGVNMGKYQVVRFNYLHNEAWFDDSSYGGYCAAQENCGYRVMSTSSDYGFYMLIENNWIAYGAQYGGGNLAGGGSGSGLSLGTSNNIVRYNYLYGNVQMGARFGSSVSNDVTDNYVYNNTFYYNGHDHNAVGVESAGVEDDLFDDNRGGFRYYGAADVIYDNVLKNNLFYNNWSERNYNNTATYYSPLQSTTALNAVNTHENNYLSSDWTSYPYSKSSAQGVYAAENDPLFVDATLPVGGANIIAAWSSYAVTAPDLSLQYNSPAKDQGTYLTTVHADDTSSGTSLILTDASYFQDGTWGSDLATLSPDTICVGATIAAADCFEVGTINYATNTITVTDFTREDGDKVWLQKDSGGSVVLFGDAPDYGAFEYLTLTVSTVTIDATGQYLDVNLNSDVTSSNSYAGFTVAGATPEITLTYKEKLSTSVIRFESNREIKNDDIEGDLTLSYDSETGDVISSSGDLATFSDQAIDNHSGVTATSGSTTTNAAGSTTMNALGTLTTTNN